MDDFIEITLNKGSFAKNYKKINNFERPHENLPVLPKRNENLWEDGDLELRHPKPRDRKINGKVSRVEIYTGCYY